MRLDIRRGLSVIVLVLVAATNCSHNTLRGSAADLSVVLTPSPPGAGRYVGVGNDKATMFINTIQVLPADPATAALYETPTGTASLQFRFTPFDANLAGTQEVEFAHISLSSGTYRVFVLEVDPLVLIDDNVTPDPSRCIANIAVIDGQTPSDQPSQVFDFPNPGDTPASLTFTVRPGQTKLAFKVNVPDLIRGYEDSYTCQFGCGFGGAPCLTAFSVESFRAAVLANVTIE